MSNWKFVWVIAFLFNGTFAFANSVTLDRIEASVNTQLVFFSDLSKFRKTISLRKQLDPLFSQHPISTKDKTATDAEIVDFLINERIVAQAYPVIEADVEQEVNSIQANNRIDRKTLKSALSEQGFDFGDYFELIRNSISKRNLIDREIRTRVTITDDDIKNYFVNYYRGAEGSQFSYKIRMLSISPSQMSSVAAAKDFAQRAYMDLKSGSDFADVAGKYGTDPNSKSGGDLGFLSEDEMAPAVRDQTIKLKVGEVSGIFGSEDTAFFIIKLEDVKSNQDSKMDRLKDEIRSQLLANEYFHQISLWLDRQRQLAVVKINK